MIDSLEKISKIGIILILLGYFNLYFYYSSFGVNIFPYLETTELIFSFSSLSHSVFLIFFLIVLVGFSFPSWEERNDKHSNSLKKNLFWNILITCFGVMLVMLVNIIPVRIINFYELIIYDAICLSLIVYFYLSYKPTYERAEKHYLKGLLTLLLSLVFVFTRAYNSVKNIVSGYPKYSIELTIDSYDIIATNDSICYIGSTNNYTFFHNLKSRENRIIPNSEIRDIRIKELRGGL